MVLIQLRTVYRVLEMETIVHSILERNLSTLQGTNSPSLAVHKFQKIDSKHQIEWHLDRI